MDFRVCPRFPSSKHQLNRVAGTLLHRTLIHLGHPPNLISVHHLAKGTNVHSDEEQDRMIASGRQRIVVLDQGSRPGRALVPSLDGEASKRVLIVDHHMSDQVSHPRKLCRGVLTGTCSGRTMLKSSRHAILYPSLRQLSLPICYCEIYTLRCVPRSAGDQL